MGAPLVLSLSWLVVQVEKDGHGSSSGPGPSVGESPCGAGCAPVAAASYGVGEGPGGCCCPPPPSGCQLVLHNEHLLMEVLAFLVEGHTASLSQLCELMLVSRLWQRALGCDRVWAPIARRLLPPPCHQHQQTTRSTSTSSSPSGLANTTYEAPPPPRERVLAFGRAVSSPLYRVGSSWTDGLSLTFDIRDRWDGRRLFFGHGQLHVSVNQNVICRLAGTDRTEVGRQAGRRASRL